MHFSDERFHFTSFDVITCALRTANELNDIQSRKISMEWKVAAFGCFVRCDGNGQEMVRHLPKDC